MWVRTGEEDVVETLKAKERGSGGDWRKNECWARSGDQDDPKGRRREPNVREPAQRVKKPCTE